MREIKFRQPIVNPDGTFVEWHYWGFSDWGNMAWWISPIEKFNVPSYEYTGLKGKNGKEIYEGDIVESNKVFGDLVGKQRAVIEYDTGRFRGNRIGRAMGMDMTWISNNCEIIGNIWENPELINK